MLNHVHECPLSHSPRKPRNTFHRGIIPRRMTHNPGSPNKDPIVGEENASLSLNYARDYVKRQPTISKMRSKRNRSGEDSERGAFDTEQIYGRSYGARLYYYYSKQEDLQHAINYACTRLKAFQGDRLAPIVGYTRRLRAISWWTTILRLPLYLLRNL